MYEVSCPECRGVGWLLNENHTGSGPGNPTKPLSLDLLPCIYPDCDGKPVRQIAVLSVRGQFGRAVLHPYDGSVMSLTDFIAPIYR